MQEFYYELKVRPSASLTYYTDFINTIFSQTIEEQDDAIILRSQEDLTDIQWAIEQYTAKLEEHLNQKITLDCTVDKKANQDWVHAYQKSVTGVDVGSFYIRPSWEPNKDEYINIIIDPALAFGSGHHATTASCLQAIDTYVKPENHVLDVGCGSGVLAIAAAKKGANVDACDTDQEAVWNTTSNALENSVDIHSVFKGSVNSAKGTYDVVIANIVADVLTIIAKDIYDTLNQGGIAILSGILDKYEERVMTRYKDFTLQKRILNDEWVTLIMKKG